MNYDVSIYFHLTVGTTHLTLDLLTVVGTATA